MIISIVLLPRCTTGDGRCYGTSPTGIRWMYVQPQHSGSRRAVHWLLQSEQRLNISTCLHGHYMSGPGDVGPIDFSFSFVANPYRRVLSNAEFHQARLNYCRLARIRCLPSYS